MKERLRESITEAVEQRTGLKPEDIPAFNLEVPHLERHGDFATNVALVLARLLGQPPRELAGLLRDQLSSLDFLQRVEIAGPGFINFFVHPDAWRLVLVDILSRGADYGRSRAEKPEQILIEYVSANPTGPLHFGHGRGAVVGDVLANLLEFVGHRVSREFYVNDAGAQVRALALSVVVRLKEKRGIETSFPDDGYRGAYVKELADCLPPGLSDFLPGDPDEKQLQAIQDSVTRAMLADIKKDLEEFGVRMDQFRSEKELIQSGRLQEASTELERRGFLQDQDGARWFLSDRFGDEKPRVLVKQDGSNTYFFTDIAYHLDKVRRGFDRLINILGADHHGYVPRMKAALQALGYPAEAFEVVLFQMVSLVRDGLPVVLSKREGEIIPLREVIDEVGNDAARFFFLLRGTDSQMEFDLELAKKRSLDNPVFYVQYGHARLSSILSRAAERGIPVPDPAEAHRVDLRPLELEQEMRLIKKMAVFKEAVVHATASRSPHQIVFYLQELVATFHHYYTTTSRTRPILKGDPSQISARLILVQALRSVLRVALRLLGVSAPDRMEAIEVEEER